MEKKLLEEIKRINTINNGGKLLNEGIPGVAAEFWTDIIRKISGKGADDVISLADITPTFNRIIDDANIDVPESTLDDLTEIINNPNHWDTLSATAKRNVMKVYSEIDEIATPIYEAIMTKTGTKDVDWAVKIREMRVNNPGMSYDDAVDAVFKGTPQEGMGPIVGKRVKPSYNAYVAKMSRINKTAKILQKWKYTSNIGRLVELLSERMKSMDEIVTDIKEIMNRSFTSMDDVKRFRRDLENKLLALEKLKDGGAQSAVDDILAHFKTLKKNGQISDGEFNAVKEHFESITKGTKRADGTYSPNRVWEEIIEPMNDDLDKELNGWKSYYDRVVKTLPGAKRVVNKSGKSGWKFSGPSWSRLANFVIFQSTQTGKDILKRYITSRGGKYFFNSIPINDVTQVALQTYLRAILFKAMLPALEPLAYTIVYKASDYMKDDTPLDWPSEEFIKDMGIKMDEAWKEAIDEDGFFHTDSELTTWTYNDLIPALSTYVDDALEELLQLAFSRDPEDIVVPDTPTTDSDSTATEPTIIDRAVNASNILPQGLKNAVPDQYEDKIEMVGGVWVFHDESGTDYKLKKGDDLKDDSTEYPFENESLRGQLDDNVWYVLNPLDGGKYVPLILSATLTENIKRKGLAVLLEQINTNDPNAQVGGGSNSGSGSNNTGSSSGAQRANEEQKRKEELENRMLAMFEKFMVYDGESGRDLIEGSKLTTRDKESIINDCFDALISKFNGVMNIDEKVVDDTVVLNTILYLINDKKMDPFKIMYKSPLELDAKLMESVGLEKILYEQGVGVNYNTIYINYIDGSTEDKIEFIKGGSAERTARANYNKRLGQNSVQDTPTPSPTPRPQQTSEQRPEEAMEIKTPKMMKRHMRNEKS